MAEMAAAGMGTASAGAGVGIAGILGGLLGGAGIGATGAIGGAGQFGQLLAGLGVGVDGGVAGTPAGGLEDLQAMLQGLMGGSGAQLSVPLTGVDGQPLGIQIEGTQTSVSVLIQRVEIVVQQLEKAGVALNQLMNSSDPKAQLAAALEQMGMSPEDALAQAERIETAMKMAKEKLKLNGDQTGQLAVLMLAGTQAPQLVQQAPTTSDYAVQVSVTSVEAQVTQTTLKVSSFLRAARTDVADAARALTGVDGDGGAKGMTLGEAMPGDAEDALVLGLTDAGATLANGEGEAMADLRMAGPVAGEKADTLAAVATPAVMAQALPAAALDSRAAARSSSNLTPVEKDKLLEKPVGEVMYHWKASETGVDDVKATPAVHRAMESMVSGGHAEAAPTLMDGSAAGVFGTSSDFGSFADRLASAMRHSATQQATVQLQQLGGSLNAAGGGGGNIKMLLNPESLGGIRIELTVKDGAVHGTIAASDGAVVEMLARDVHQLKYGLAEAGLKLGQDGINLMLSDAGSQQGQHQQGQNAQNAAQQANNRAGRAGAAAGEVDALSGTATEAAPLTGWVSPDRLVDVRV